MKYYAGIGSRETPIEILEQMVDLARTLDNAGFTLRSGKAWGADTAFEKGSKKLDLYTPKDATPETIELALKFHPNPEALKKKGDFVLGLMGRNMQIISGRKLDSNVEFVICWTKDGKASGGTGQAMRYATSLSIPVYNLKLLSKEEILEKIGLNQ